MVIKTAFPPRLCLTAVCSLSELSETIAEDDMVAVGGTGDFW